jgi:hypothetical protein
LTLSGFDLGWFFFLQAFKKYLDQKEKEI